MQKINTIVGLMHAFSCPGRQVYFEEFAEFWNSCTDEQRDYYLTAEIF